MLQITNCLHHILKSTHPSSETFWKAYAPSCLSKSSPSPKHASQNSECQNDCAPWPKHTLAGVIPHKTVCHKVPYMDVIFLRASAYVCADFPSRKSLVHHFLTVSSPTAIGENWKKLLSATKSRTRCKAHESAIFGTTFMSRFQ
jgi:hypothetical protein